MPKTEIFDADPARYDAWYDQHQAAYLSELLAIRTLMPVEGKKVEVGVGTGRFAAPLGVQQGIDPAAGMRQMAEARGIEVMDGSAENLPLAASSVDVVLMVTTLCFLDDPQRFFSEAHRVLDSGGHLVIGLLDNDSKIGRSYISDKANGAFFGEANPYGAAQLEEDLAATGFLKPTWVQTLTALPHQTLHMEAAKAGHGEGLFAVVRVQRP